MGYWARFEPRRIFRIVATPDACLRTFDRDLAAANQRMPDFEARSLQLRYRRKDSDLVAIRNLPKESGLEIDDGNPGKIMDLAHLRFGQAGCTLQQKYAAPVEIFDEARVKDDTGRIHPVYLIQRVSDDRIQGCVRLLPSTGPTMLRDAFPALLAGESAPASSKIWESSRFALDVGTDAPKAAHGIASATYELFAGMIEFGLSRKLTDIVTVTDARMERILRRAGWPLRRIGDPRTLGNTLAVAGYLDVSIESLARVRSAGGLKSPALWAPVALAAA
jgi:acyl homoserine lactone synthase